MKASHLPDIRPNAHIGEVESRNITAQLREPQEMVVQVEGRTAGRGGDSGGPMFSLIGSDGVRAKGIVSAGSGTELLFQDWADVLRKWPNMYPVMP